MSEIGKCEPEKASIVDLATSKHTRCVQRANVTDKRPEAGGKTPNDA